MLKQLPVNFWTIILVLGSAGIFIILFYLFRLSKNLKKYIPLLIFVILSLIELVTHSIIKINPDSYPNLLYITEPFSMLYGLLIYFYARNYTNQNLKFRKTDILYFIPLLLSIMSYLPYFILDPKEKLADFITYGNLKTDVSENIWEWNFEIVFNSAFLLAALKEIKKYNLNIKEHFSDIQQISLRLTQFVIKICIISYLFELLSVYLTLFGFPYYKLLFNIFNIINFVVIIVIGYEAIISKKYIEGTKFNWTNTIETKQNKKAIKYAKSTLTLESSNKIKTNLLIYMSKHKPFLQPQLRIKDLSEMTGIPSHHISQVINESFNQNFYEFINSYRINEAKKMLKDPKYKNYTYTAIGFEAGFNSKSTFYTTFKKLTGTSPANY